MRYTAQNQHRNIYKAGHWTLSKMKLANAGQFHHGTRKEESLINQCVEYGLLIDRNIVGRTGEKAYNIFGKWSIVFP